VRVAPDPDLRGTGVAPFQRGGVRCAQIEEDLKPLSQVRFIPTKLRPTADINGRPDALLHVDVLCGDEELLAGLEVGGLERLLDWGEVRGWRHVYLCPAGGFGELDVIAAPMGFAVDGGRAGQAWKSPPIEEIGAAPIFADIGGVAELVEVGWCIYVDVGGMLAGATKALRADTQNNQFIALILRKESLDRGGQ
jgi:hypothetical protein